MTIKIITVTVAMLRPATQCECWPSARRANGNAKATRAYAVRKPKTESEPNQSYMSDPCTPLIASAAVAASIRLAVRAIAAPGVPCLLLVRSNTPGSRPPCAIRSSTRAAAVVQASTQANMLTAAPKSMATPSGEMPALAASRCSGLVELLSCEASPRKPSTSEYEHSIKNTPARMAHCITARGMVLRGSRASPPSVVAASNPTKLNIESTSAGPSAEIETPFSLNWSRSNWNPKRKTRTSSTTRMRLTETTSIQSINSAESLTSL